MKYKLLSIIAIGLLPFFASAEDVKLGVVEMDSLFKNYYKTKIANAKLKKQGEAFKEYSDKLAASYLKLNEEWKVLRDASLNIAFSETQRESKRLAAQDKYRQLDAKKKEHEQYSREKHIQIRDEEAKMRKNIITEIRKTIAKYARVNGFTMVLDSSGKTLNQISSVIYYKTEIEITDTILELINKGAER